MTGIHHEDGSPWDPTVRIDGNLYPPNIAVLWDDAQLAAIGLHRGEQPESRRRVLKATVEQRLIDDGLMEAAFAALSSSGVMFARWYSRVSDSVFADDTDALQLLAAIGADPVRIMAP